MDEMAAHNCLDISAFGVAMCVKNGAVAPDDALLLLLLMYSVAYH